MGYVIVRHVKSLPISPGPHTCVHVAHTYIWKRGREGGREGGMDEEREGRRK